MSIKKQVEESGLGHLLSIFFDVGWIGRCRLGGGDLRGSSRLGLLLWLRCLSFCLFSLETVSLLTSLLQLGSELVKVLLELSSAFDRDLETRVRSRLDPDHLDVAPGRQNIDNLSQLGHALRAETLQDQRLMLVQVEHVLDDAHILVGG